MSDESRRELQIAGEDALLRAHEMGYFEVPRQCTLNDVADVVGLPATAVSEAIRRGITERLEQET